MNGEIKYENCVEMWESQPNNCTGLGDCRGGEASEANTTNLKRSYNAMGSNGGIDEGRNNAYQHRNLTQQNNDNQNHHQYMNIYPAKLTKRNPIKLQRKRKNEISLVFQPPFFQLQKDHALLKPRSIISARCLSCNVFLRGNKYVSSNFIKHLKRVHPNMYKIYENMKVLKSNGFATAAAAAAGGSTGNVDFEQNDNDNIERNVPSAEDQESLRSDGPSYITEGTDNAEENSPTVTCKIEDEEDNEHISEMNENSVTSLGNDTPEAVNIPSNQTRTAGQLRVVANESLHAVTTIPSVLKEEQPAKVDLSAETLKAMSNLLDQKLKHFVTKAEFNRNARNSTESANAQTDSNNTTDLQRRLQQQVTVLQKECSDLRTAIKRVQRGNHLLHREVNATDRIIRRGKLIIHNIRVEPNEMPLKVVENLFREILALPHIKVQKAVPLARSMAPGNKRKLLVELQNHNDTKQILQNCKRLKNTGIYIEPELSQYARKRAEKLLVLRKEILRRNAQIKVFVRSTQLIVEGNYFYWDDIDGLCVGNLDNTDMVEMDALECMEKLTGMDLREFLNVLQNYDIKMT